MRDFRRQTTCRARDSYRDRQAQVATTVTIDEASLARTKSLEPNLYRLRRRRRSSESFSFRSAIFDVSVSQSDDSQINQNFQYRKQAAKRKLSFVTQVPKKTS